MGCGASVGEGGPQGTAYRPLRPMVSVDVQTDEVYAPRPYDEDKDEDETETSDKVPLLNNVPKGKRTKSGYDPTNMEELWYAVCQTLDVPKGEKSKIKDLVIKRSGWKTIRIFVSSTFKDFHHEREMLVKEVFPDLRAWCEVRRLHLVECDLRWGVPKDSTTESTLRTCLGEIDRCYADNMMPYFLNMTSERIGWIPSKRDVPQGVVDDYKWIFGLSMTEMEIMHGAYRKDNPNSFFLIRDDSFLDTMPTDMQRTFIDENPLASPKLKALKEQIGDRFPIDRVVKYGCSYSEFVSEKVQLKIDDVFKTSIFEFFKARISKQYPLDETTVDAYQQMRDSHEAFMKSKAGQVLGRTDILNEISTYISGDAKDVPLLVLGGPGSGKSSILAKVADITEQDAFEKKLPKGGNKGWHVFYHFVGAVPGSTELEPTLKRLLKELEVVNDATMPTDMDSTCQMCNGALSNPYTRPAIIIIDALNQFYEEAQALSMLWVPRKLPPNIRVVLSMIPDTPQHKALMSRESKPNTVEVNPLDLKARMIIVRDVLGRYNKTLDLDQMVTLLAKDSSANPLWLSIACEELRVFGDFHKITDKVSNLKDGLLELLGEVLTRFEDENGGYLLVATLCLLEVSETGLLESEFLSILADEDNLMPPSNIDEKGGKEKSEKSNTKAYNDKLPAYKWATVFRALRPFLRPYGDSGEGRLDFYHRSLSKAVRRKYLKVSPNDAESDMTKLLYRWWHKKLADYYEFSDKFDRRVEEYPHHLKALDDQKRMIEFLCEEFTVEKLYRPDYSARLINFWREGGGGLQTMEDKYKELILNFANTPDVDKQQLALKYEQMANLLLQVGANEVSKEFAFKALEFEEQSLGNRPERLVEIYDLLTIVLDAICKHKYEFLFRSMLPSLQNTLSWARKAVTIRKTMKGAQHEFKLARLNVKMAFTLSAWVDVGGNGELTAIDARNDASEMLDQAITLFSKLKDIGNLAEAKMTKALLFRAGRNPEQVKYYKEAIELCEQAYGENSHLMGRIYHNFAIYYEDKNEMDKAFDLFYKCYQVRVIFNGPDHPHTHKAISVLREPNYYPIAVQRGITIPAE